MGAEVPDTFASVSVARRGYGSMALANALGSQITNILLGLGLPYTGALLSACLLLLLLPLRAARPFLRIVVYLVL